MHRLASKQPAASSTTTTWLWCAGMHEPAGCSLHSANRSGIACITMYQTAKPMTPRQQSLRLMLANGLRGRRSEHAPLHFMHVTMRMIAIGEHYACSARESTHCMMPIPPGSCTRRCLTVSVTAQRYLGADATEEYGQREWISCFTRARAPQRSNRGFPRPDAHHAHGGGALG